MLIRFIAAVTTAGMVMVAANAVFGVFLATLTLGFLAFLITDEVVDQMLPSRGER